MQVHDAEIELLEKYGLIRVEDTLKLEAFAPKRLLRLQGQLYSAIFDRQRNRHWEHQSTHIDPFTFMATTFES